MNRALKYGTILIATYLIVANATGFGKAVSGASGFVVAETKALQGR